MLVYHGSNHNFKKFRISKSLVEHQSTLENEGLGIYFSTDMDTARSYGKYLYSFYVKDTVLQDFRLKATCQMWLSNLVRYIKSQAKINLYRYIDSETLVLGMQSGRYSLCNMDRNIYLVLDSTESWHLDIPATTQERVYRLMNSYTKRTMVAYLFNYNIKNVGVVKVVNDNIVQIVNKEYSYS